MDLKTAFFAQKPREKSGAISSSRFGYQKDISLSMLLEHELSELPDYVFIFDFHEDLVIMDTESSPTQVAFYQIKGKTPGSWTLRTLSKTLFDKENKPLLSTLGKLYDCREKFKDQTRRLGFLSNAPVKIGLEDKSSSESKQTIQGVELCKKDKEVLGKNLKEQLGLSEDVVIDDLLEFRVLDISLTDSERHLKGILADFFKRRFDIAPDVDLIYKNFLNEINKKSNYQKDINSFDEVIKNKAIPKSTFTQWVEHIVHQEAVLKDKWPQVASQLNSEQTHFSEMRQLKTAWTTFTLYTKDPNNQYLKQARTLIKQHSRPAVEGKKLTLYGEMELIYETIAPKLSSAVNDEWVTKAIILSEIY